MSVEAVQADVTVRRGRPGDDYARVFTVYPGHWINPEQVLVAVAEEQIVGLLMIWDGGHSVVKVDHLVTDPDYPSAGPKLILAFNEWCQAHGKVEIDVVTPSLELAYHGKRRGATVQGPYFRILYGVTDREGAHHA
jgi:hypothetical protein